MTPPRLIFCTICSANYLPRAMLLADSLRRSHQEVDFRVLLAEHPTVVARLRPRLAGVGVYAPDQVGCAAWRAMAFYYDVLEYNTALKPWFMRTLLREGNVVYLDPDIEAFSSFEHIEGALDTSDFVLTPHNTRPIPADGKRPTALDVLRCGQFNLGFLAVRQTRDNDALLRWWEERLTQHCTVDLREGLFVDQVWAAAFASFARKVHIERSAQYNMAYWNVFQRHLRIDEHGRPQTEDGPLVFFHYSGLELDRLERVSRHQDRVTAPTGSPLRHLLEGYARQLADSRYRDLASHPYSFDRFEDGTKITATHRRGLLELHRANRHAPADPFAARPHLALRSVSSWLAPLAWRGQRALSKLRERRRR